MLRGNSGVEIRWRKMEASPQSLEAGLLARPGGQECKLTFSLGCGVEADELEHTPESEQRELALIYQAKGLDREEAHRVAAQLEEEDISAEVIDLRTIKPLDEKAIFNSIAKTHRVVIAEQDRPFCGVGAEICYRIQKNIFDELDAPIIRVSQEDVPMPYNEHLEKAVLPNADTLIAAAKSVCYA